MGVIISLSCYIVIVISKVLSKAFITFDNSSLVKWVISLRQIRRVHGCFCQVWVTLGNLIALLLTFS
jgi:hypothetical protein